ncbi:MAG TPA: sigma-54-dependent Fis family transcriptional regulator, partial [Gemmataceae bacterium]|nr:sigma-54-dependent Fis family transcriptional regulator [Gemmataceae bacterium]
MYGLTVLLSSTDPTLAEAVGKVVASVEDLNLEVCARPELVCRRAAVADVALVLLHAGPGGDAAALLRDLRVAHKRLPVVVLGEQDDPEQELALFRQGATEYLARPIDLNRLRLAVDSHTVDARVALGLGRSGDVAVESSGGEPFLYVPDGEMGHLLEQLRRIAALPATVLLGGETGTGKTRVARLLHELSPRQDEPFLTVNCGTLSESLIESEMFGHVRGAYTGADRDRVGKFADAGRGTLLLDDIDALPLSLQGKLLRVVDERVFEPVGTNRRQAFEARLVVASNRRLDEEVRAGRFRADLFYRLNVVGFYLPPLRDRAEVIPHLARKFAADFAAAAGLPTPDIAAEAMDALDGHAWPGNVRELRNVIERAVALGPAGAIRLVDLPHTLRESAPVEAAPARAVDVPASGATLSRSKEEAEKLCITEALRRYSNNRLRAAAALGISRMTLYNKLRKYGLA